MKTIVAVIDAGGRGSALVDKYARSSKVDEIIAIPGNDLMENNFKVVGASKDAGRLEWDKAWSREFMVKYDLPVPKYQVCNSVDQGINFLETQNDQAWFIKASGLAEGKGVIPARNNEEAVLVIKEMSKFGVAGETYLIEQALIGEEFSSFAISDGNSYQILSNAQDHKRVNDGDTGPNTGGMGCSTPVLVVDENIQNQVNEIFKKTFEGLRKENLTYQGIIYLGGIVVKENNKDKVYIIEYNCRWGDPEVECILPGIENDWFEIGLAVAEGKLNQIRIKHDGSSRIVVAACSKGYPENYSVVKDKEIIGLKELIQNKEIKVYCAGVRKSEDKYLANGGRLFYVVAEGKNVLQARQKVY